MQRHLRLHITEPASLEQGYLKEIECVTINVNLLTGKVTLPGGVVCSLRGLMHVVSQANEARFKFMLIEYDPIKKPLRKGG